jgi:hypothetical protein
MINAKQTTNNTSPNFIFNQNLSSQLLMPIRNDTPVSQILKVVRPITPQKHH